MGEVRDYMGSLPQECFPKHTGRAARSLRGVRALGAANVRQ